MKISDQGFKQMLSLGLLSETSADGVYFLYVWDDLNYYCGPEGAFESSGLEGIYIELSSNQLGALPKRKRSTSLKKDSTLSKVLEFFETALILTLSEDQKTFKAKQVMGSHETLEHLRLDSNQNSPLKIIKDSKKPFHGIYAPLEPLQSKLTSLGVNTHNLWITAVPIIKNNNFEGVLMGMSQDVDYGIDVIDFFNKCAGEIDLAA